MTQFEFQATPHWVETLRLKNTDVCCFCLQWHSLSREEQAKYYELARKERQLHSQLYPGWSARDNYVSWMIL